MYTTLAWTILESRGSSMAWLARQTGFDDSYLFHLRSGRRPITRNVAERISAALDLPMEEVFFVHDETNEIAKSATSDSRQSVSA